MFLGIGELGGRLGYHKLKGRQKYTYWLYILAGLW